MEGQSSLWVGPEVEAEVEALMTMVEQLVEAPSRQQTLVEVKHQLE